MCKPCINARIRDAEARLGHTWKPKKLDTERRKKYGVGTDWYEETLKKQNARCWICLRDSPGRRTSKNFCIDHDHKTGKTRGLLCSTCNSILGFIELTPDKRLTARRLLAYLIYYRII